MKKQIVDMNVFELSKHITKLYKEVEKLESNLYAKRLELETTCDYLSKKSTAKNVVKNVILNDVKSDVKSNNE